MGDIIKLSDDRLWSVDLAPKEEILGELKYVYVENEDGNTDVYRVEHVNNGQFIVEVFSEGNWVDCDYRTFPENSPKEVRSLINEWMARLILASEPENIIDASELFEVNASNDDLGPDFLNEDELYPMCFSDNGWDFYIDESGTYMRKSGSDDNFQDSRFILNIQVNLDELSDETKRLLRGMEIIRSQEL